MMIFRNHASSFAPLGFAAFGCRRHFGFGCARWTDPETLCRVSAAGCTKVEVMSIGEFWLPALCARWQIRILCRSLFPAGWMEDAMKTKVIKVYFPVFQGNVFGLWKH
jgi:hypothetical protein